MRITAALATVVLALWPGPGPGPAQAEAEAEGVRFAAPGGADGACVDAPLEFTFPARPAPGTAGVIEVRRADGSLADRVEAATAKADRKNIGQAVSDTGLPHDFSYESIMVEGRTARVHLHRQLDYGQDYTVTVDPGVFPGYSGSWRFSTRKQAPRQPRHLTVAAAGTGDFCTVQGAVDAVPLGNTRPVTIDVRPGVYTEIVYVREDRPHITVRGAGAGRTVIRYANNDLRNGDAALRESGGPADVCPRRVLETSDVHNCWRAMFGVDAADFRLSDLTLHNTTPSGGSQAEAFRGNNERIALDRVDLRSQQDTLRLQGKGFVSRSRISGQVDFVWGTGTVFIQDSVLESTGPGYISQSRNDATRPGTVFVRTRLTRAPGVPDGSVVLSRSAVWRFTHSQTVFIDTVMDAHISLKGWLIDPDDCAKAPDLAFWEYGSADPAGRPIDVSQRLACSRQLTAAEAERWSDPEFVLGGWDPEKKG
ncbi:pectinesterase family protein [Nonomuraea sp. NBC_00507]|uniref:pectinesterase family protein n=1 Tax=Nonomuraea sp. NBC_00507 TaxID=2976002 RepID=UPI002E19F10C